MNHYRYRFEVESAIADEEVFLTGSLPELGNWIPEHAKKLEWNRKKIWSISDLILPSTFQYNFFHKKNGKISFEKCGKRTVDLHRNHKGIDDSVVEICLQDTWDAPQELALTLNKKQWWKTATVYQIYPRSFCDSNGDGIGDIRGIISKLDYLKELGVDVLWLSPIYKSPMIDNGYDISDYRKIAEEFGTMKDFEDLVVEMKQRGLKLMMDLVVNHTSDQHPWFIESKKSKENKCRDYYIWRPPNSVTGREPNNWISFFGGSAWELDPNTGEYYLHLFAKEQPDLNWENSDVRKEIFGMMDFWLQKGVEGFRMDVINVISKVTDFPDAVETVEGMMYQWGGEFFVNGPRLMEFLREMHEKVLNKKNLITVGETPFFGIDEANKMTNERNGVVNMLFHFEMMGLDIKSGCEKWYYKPWELSEMKQVMSGWQRQLQGKGWNSLYLENHDQPRSISRFGNDGRYHSESAKMLATWLFMMQGTPYIYQGQEIGMTNVPFGDISEYRDVETTNFYEFATKTLKRNPQEVLQDIARISRDNGRTPMHWSASENAGFGSGEPWIKINPNYININVEDSQKNPDSILNHYRKLIAMKKQYQVIVYGSFREILSEHQEIYAYIRKFYDQNLLVVANFKNGEPQFQLPAEISMKNATLLISNYSVDNSKDVQSFEMKPYEVRVYLYSEKE